MTQRTARFHLYRYQLLPTDRFFQGSLYGVSTIEELISKKNEIFQEALASSFAFHTNRTETSTKQLMQSEDFLLYRIAANRSLSRETKDFQTETLDNWPKILVVIWNDPSKQLIAIQHRTNAFQNTDAVMRLIFESIEPLLEISQLTAIWEPLFERQHFWDLITQYDNKIQEIEFELVTPNMANISRALPEELKDFAKSTNAIKSKIAIQADPASTLHVEQTNKSINALVNYSSEGGGNISLKVTGMKKKIHTAKMVKEFEIDDFLLQGEPADVAEILKKLLS